MQKSPTIGSLAKALVAFQGKVGKVKKDAKNPFFKSKYASLSNILDVIQTPLAEAGLAISQLPDGDEMLTTILIHAESGEFLESTYNIHAGKKDPQGIGSAITYARRYALGAVLGLNIDEDDDGNAATGNGQQRQGQLQDGVTDTDIQTWQAQLKNQTTLDEVTALYNSNKPTSEMPRIKALFTARKDEIKRAA